MIVLTVLFLAEKINRQKLLSAFFSRVKNLHTRKQATEVILVGLFGKFQSIKKVGGRFLSGSLFVSPSPPECNFQSKTKIEPDLRVLSFLLAFLNDWLNFGVRGQFEI